MKRLSIEEYAAYLALAGKSRSEDVFRQVSAVGLRKDKSIIGISYNGLKAGMQVPEWMKLEENRHKKSEFFIHAEDNLLKFCGIGECDTLVGTISPCLNCAKHIVAKQVRRVIYIQEYPSCSKFKEIFDFYGVIYEQLSEQSRKNILEYIKDLSNFEELL